MQVGVVGKLETKKGKRREEKGPQEKCQKQMKTSLQLLELLKSLGSVSNTADKCHI